jgi:hypothetical protein
MRIRLPACRGQFRYFANELIASLATTQGLRLIEFLVELGSAGSLCASPWQSCGAMRDSMRSARACVFVSGVCFDGKLQLWDTAREGQNS